MKRQKLYDTKVEFNSEEGDKLEISYDNRGEPYRQGASFHFSNYGESVTLFLETHEVIALRNVLTRIIDNM